MRIVASLNAMQRLALRWKRAGTRVALVPTMGYLHEGHASLIRRARREAGPRGKVVVSLYVNPTQFAPTEDLSRYPRDFLRDRASVSKWMKGGSSKSRRSRRATSGRERN